MFKKKKIGTFRHSEGFLFLLNKDKPNNRLQFILKTEDKNPFDWQQQIVNGVNDFVEKVSVGRILVVFDAPKTVRNNTNEQVERKNRNIQKQENKG
jgi:hypothetical protein